MFLGMQDFNFAQPNQQPDGASDKRSAFWCRRNRVQIPSRSNIPDVVNDSPPLQPWCVALRKAAEMGTDHSWHPKVIKRV